MVEYSQGYKDNTRRRLEVIDAGFDEQARSVSRWLSKAFAKCRTNHTPKPITKDIDMTERRMVSYDPECEKLALHFLGAEGLPAATTAEVEALSQRLQDAVEDFFFARENT